MNGKENAVKMQESGEMYLETILVLSKRLNVVRSVDIAEEMGYSKPSVSRAVGKLKEDKYIVVDEDGFIALTGKGRTVAERIYERHTVLTDLLIRIGVSPETAAADACRVEHDISEETFEAIKKTVREQN